jgi:hypothetical protein
VHPLTLDGLPTHDAVGYTWNSDAMWQVLYDTARATLCALGRSVHSDTLRTTRTLLGRVDVVLLPLPPAEESKVC